MRKEASLDQWKQIYDVTLKIKEMKPWEHLWDMDLISIHLPGKEEPSYFSIMGKAGECLGINAYIGYEGLSDFFDIADSESNGMSPQFAMFNQNCLVCYFDDREQVPAKQKKVIKDLGLKFRGHNQWVFFESFKKGYFPYILDAEEVNTLIEYYDQLYIILQEFISGNIQANFEEGECLIRSYDSEKGTWSNYASPLSFPRRIISKLILKDEVLMAKLKKQQTLPVSVELDMFYIDAMVKDKEFERPINPLMIALLERDQGYIIGQDMLSPEDDRAYKTANMLIGLIMQHGKPKEVYATNPYVVSLIEDICSNLGIKIISDKRLTASLKLQRDLMSNLGR